MSDVVEYRYDTRRRRGRRPGLSAGALLRALVSKHLNGQVFIMGVVGQKREHHLFLKGVVGWKRKHS